MDPPHQCAPSGHAVPTGDWAEDRDVVKKSLFFTRTDFDVHDLRGFVVAGKEFNSGRGRSAQQVRQELSPRWLTNFSGPSASHCFARQPEPSAETLRRPWSLLATVADAKGPV